MNLALWRLGFNFGICGEQGDTGAEYFVFPLPIIVSPTLHTHLSLSLRCAITPDQPARHHNIRTLLQLHLCQTLGWT
jgi:hypothetical protein